MTNKPNDPTSAFKDTIALLDGGHHKRQLILNEDFIKHLDPFIAKKLFRERISNARDFTFLFVGNVDETDLPVIQKYIGNIKTDERHIENYVDHVIGLGKGKNSSVVKRDMNVPKASIYVHLGSHNVTYSPKNDFMAQILGRLLSKTYLDMIREKEGASYGVWVGAKIEQIPRSHFSLKINFDCNPEKSNALLDVIYLEINKLKQQDSDSSYLKAVKANMIKNLEEREKTNGYWANELKLHLLEGRGHVSRTAFELILEDISPTDIREFANSIMDGHNTVEVIMRPLGE